MLFCGVDQISFSKKNLTNVTFNFNQMGISYTTHTCILTLVLLFTKEKLNVISISFFFGRNQSIHN